MNTETIGTSKNDLQISVHTDGSVNTYSRNEKLNIVDNAIGPPVTYFYHMNEIQQNNAIISTARGIIWAGFGVICIGVIFALLGKVDAALLTTISGLITETISGTVFAFVSQSDKNKLQYFKHLSMTEEGDKIIKVIDTLDKDAKEKMIEKIVDNYCNRRQPN